MQEVPQFNIPTNIPGFSGQPVVADMNFNNNIANLGQDNKTNNLNIEPSNLSGWQLLGKAFLGFLIGVVISGLLFIAMSFVGNIFTDALQSTTKTNPLLPFLLLFIGFLASFVGNMIVAGSYSLFFSKKYYDSGKMFGFLLLTNAILFFVLAPVYLIFSKDVSTLFVILAFHILFAVFVSANQIEFLANPNYSGSALMGNTLGFAGAILVYMMIYKISKASGSIQNQTYLLMLFPAILGFALIPFGSGIWEKVYYKIYEMGSNAFYIPSLSEVTTNESEQDTKELNEEIHVDMA